MIGGISVTQLLILLVIVMLVFGTKRLRNIGSDLGSAIKGFRKGMEDETEDKDIEPEKIDAQASTSAEAPKKEENAAATRPTEPDV